MLEVGRLGHLSSGLCVSPLAASTLVLTAEVRANPEPSPHTGLSQDPQLLQEKSRVAIITTWEVSLSWFSVSTNQRSGRWSPSPSQPWDMTSSTLTFSWGQLALLGWGPSPCSPSQLTVQSRGEKWEVRRGRHGVPTPCQVGATRPNLLSMRPPVWVALTPAGHGPRRSLNFPEPEPPRWDDQLSQFAQP